MKIVILGAGRVGASVAASLVSERNDITVVDTDVDQLKELQDRLDLRTVVGNGTHPPVLEQAGIDDADMLIATAARDETNLVACQLAARLYNVPTRIARVRAPEFQDHPEITGEGGFYVDHLICPEQQRWRDRQAECLGGLDIDDELELYRSLDGKLVWCRTLENAIGIGRRPPKIIVQVIPV